MIVFLAATLWLSLWLTAPTGLQSNLKINFPVFEEVEELRARFLFHLTGVSEDSAGLVAGLAIGERGMISNTLTENMNELSLTHLVAVSGANLAIIAATVFLVLSAIGLPRNWRFALAYLAIAGYILLVGPESSVLRAGAMAAFVMAGWWLGRKVNPLIPLSWAVLCLLVIDQGLAVDIGFTLSVFATLGLLVLAAALHSRLAPRLGMWLSIGISASVAAQLYTLPVLLLLQPSIPVYSVLANLAVEPAVAPVTVLGILAVVAALWFPTLTQLLTLFASFGTWWIEIVANQLSQMPVTRLPMLPGSLGIFFTLLLVLGITLIFVPARVSLRWLGALCTCLFVVPIGWVVTDISRHSIFSDSWQVLNCDVGQGDALLIRSGGNVALVDVGREPQPIDNCLSELGIQHIDLLVLTHFDADHVGGISGALNNRTVELTLLSGFKDDRPLVSLVGAELEESASRVEIGHAGLSGFMGEVGWRVFAPSFEATEAEDSNDASLVVNFDFDEFNILTLGDLGERGQSRLLRNSWPLLFQLREKPLILKVAHHGSKDQSREFHALIQPDVAIVSVGVGNDYGHPSQNALSILADTGATVLRTDIHGAIAIRVEAGKLVASTAGKLSL